MDYIAFDTETTGIDHENEAIVEIGAVKFVNFEPGEAFSALVDPQREIPEDAIKVHGITNEMVAGKPLVKEVITDLAEFCGNLPLVAHNAKFDFKFIEAAVKRHKCQAPSGVVLDTYALAKRIVRGLPNYRLETLINHYELPSSVFHRAEEDAAYCGLVFAKIVRALVAGHHPVAVHDLLELSDMKEMRLPQIASSSEQLGLF
jgi:DNA polymerase-3 subunit epsilon